MQRDLSRGIPGGYLMISSIPVTKCEEVGVGEGWTVTRIELQRLLRTAWGFHGVKVFFSNPLLMAEVAA